MKPWGQSTSGHGASKAEERWRRASLLLAQARQRNREVAVVILVEGRKDRDALEQLGFVGPIEVLNRGWSVDDVLVDMVERYGRKNLHDDGPSMIVLMDWDRTGGRLQTQCRRNLESLDVRFDEELRQTLMVCLKPETRVVEGLKGLHDNLLPLMEIFDPTKMIEDAQDSEVHLP